MLSFEAVAAVLAILLAAYLLLALLNPERFQ
jgi:K+-transporting ATPase KdpF subunit